MRRFLVLTIAALAAAPSMALAQAPPAPQTLTLSSYAIRGYQNIQRNLLEAAEKMPEADYAFKPTSETRPFGQLVAHVALSQFGACAELKGDPAPPHKGDKEDTARSKSELIALFKESTAYCDPLLTTLKDDDLAALIKVDQRQGAKGVFLLFTVAHGNEMYGTMAVYLRLKGLVPPTTERQNAAKKSQ